MLKTEAQKTGNSTNEDQLLLELQQYAVRLIPAHIAAIVIQLVTSDVNQDTIATIIGNQKH